MIVMNRGKLFTDSEGNNKFVFNKGEPLTCGACKKDLSTTGWVCERCKNIFCYDCLAEQNACACHHFSREHYHFKANIEQKNSEKYH